MRPSCLSALSLLLLVACSREETLTVQPMQPRNFKILREYGFDCTVADPNPEWNPHNYAIVAKSAGSIAVLREGADLQEVFKASDSFDCFDPIWLDDRRILLGPDPLLKQDAEGDLVMPRGGMRVVEYTLQGLENARGFCDRGYRPRRWHDRVLAQWGDLIISMGDDGDSEPFMPGFDPVPQPDLLDGTAGPGLCYNDVALLEQDYWGGEGLGSLQIRWAEGIPGVLPDSCQANWTPRGGVLATRLPPGYQRDPMGLGTPPPMSMIVHVVGPGTEFEVVAAGAHSPAAHPRFDVFACVDSVGAIRLVSMDGTADILLAQHGSRPRWSHDGKRLMLVTPKGPVARIEVLVLDVVHDDARTIDPGGP